MTAYKNLSPTKAVYLTLRICVPRRHLYLPAKATLRRHINLLTKPAYKCWHQVRVLCLPPLVGIQILGRHTNSRSTYKFLVGIQILVGIQVLVGVQFSSWYTNFCHRVGMKFSAPSRYTNFPRPFDTQIPVDKKIFLTQSAYKCASLGYVSFLPKRHQGSQTKPSPTL